MERNALFQQTYIWKGNHFNRLRGHFDYPCNLWDYRPKCKVSKFTCCYTNCKQRYVALLCCSWMCFRNPLGVCGMELINPVNVCFHSWQCDAILYPCLLLALKVTLSTLVCIVRRLCFVDAPLGSLCRRSTCPFSLFRSLQDRAFTVKIRHACRATPECFHMFLKSRF